jgi:two-component system CheB/CheR fusion protein
VAERDSKLKKPSRRSRKDQPTEPLAIVGIGVCAASLRSLVSLFAGLSSDLGASFVVAVRQQDGLSVDTVVEALERQTELPVKAAENGERLEAGRIYVGGGSELITLTDGHVAIRPTKEPVGHRGTVDSMLISLAEHAQDRAIAVILSGLGSDGTAGVSATKQYGGLSIAESLNGEADAAEQGAASPAGIVDLLLPLEQIPSQIALYIRGLETVGAPEAAGEISEQVASLLTQIAGTLRTVTGNDFHGYKRNTFLRRVQRRMQVVQAPSIADYASRLKKDRDEVHHLFQDLLIGVTQFFRNSKEFDALEKELPKLFEGKGPNDHFWVWVLGCATGEEAGRSARLGRGVTRAESPSM